MYPGCGKTPNEQQKARRGDAGPKGHVLSAALTAQLKSCPVTKHRTIAAALKPRQQSGIGVQCCANATTLDAAISQGICSGSKYPFKQLYSWKQESFAPLL
jgi:hypothetical protein